MSFDIDPADERLPLDECIAEIKRLQAENAKLRAVAEAARDHMELFEPEVETDGTGAPRVISWRHLNNALAALDAKETT